MTELQELQIKNTLVNLVKSMIESHHILETYTEEKLEMAILAWTEDSYDQIIKIADEKGAI